MYRTSTMLAVCFCAGVIGALFNSLAVWAAGHWGLTSLAGVRIAPALTMDWLYPRLFWGGLWGLAYFLLVAHPRSRCRWIRKGLWVSLLPTAFQLFYYFPRHTSYGSMGLALGTLTPAFILVFTAIWGLFTGLFSRMLWGR
jgi:hypothetical protein